MVSSEVVKFLLRHDTSASVSLSVASCCVSLSKEINLTCLTSFETSRTSLTATAFTTSVSLGNWGAPTSEQIHNTRTVKL